jgi:hypothetical protein
MIDGLATLSKIKDDWEDFNGMEWPGAEAARESYTDETLDAKWYRRRLGRIPPKGVAAHRPIYATDVDEAWKRNESAGHVIVKQIPDAVGLDVARSGDKTVMSAVHGDVIRIHYDERGFEHTGQEPVIREYLDQWHIEDYPNPTIVVDASGEGSHLADRLYQSYPEVVRYDSGSEAIDRKQYYDKRGEALHCLGKFLRDGAVYDNRYLREELEICARTTRFDEKYYSSRDAEVLRVNSKDDIEDQLGHSPDYLDSASMAVWGAKVDPARFNTISLTW